MWFTDQNSESIESEDNVNIQQNRNLENMLKIQLFATCKKIW